MCISHIKDIYIIKSLAILTNSKALTIKIN